MKPNTDETRLFLDEMLIVLSKAFPDRKWSFESINETFGYDSACIRVVTEKKKTNYNWTKVSLPEKRRFFTAKLKDGTVIPRCFRSGHHLLALVQGPFDDVNHEVLDDITDGQLVAWEYE